MHLYFYRNIYACLSYNLNVSIFYYPGVLIPAIMKVFAVIALLAVVSGMFKEKLIKKKKICENRKLFSLDRTSIKHSGCYFLIGSVCLDVSSRDLNPVCSQDRPALESAVCCWNQLLLALVLLLGRNLLKIRQFLD